MDFSSRLGQFRNILPLKGHFTGGRRQKPQDRPTHRGLAAPTFANQPKGTPSLYLETHTIHRPHNRLCPRQRVAADLDVEIHIQPVNNQGILTLDPPGGWRCLGLIQRIKAGAQTTIHFTGPVTGNEVVRSGLLQCWHGRAYVDACRTTICKAAPSRRVHKIRRQSVDGRKLRFAAHVQPRNSPQQASRVRMQRL